MSVSCAVLLDRDGTLIEDKHYLSEPSGVALEDLAKGNLDAVMCDDPVAKYYANTKDEYRDKFHIGLVTGEPEFYGFALRKNDKELAQKLNAGIKAVQEKGIEKQILEKWFGTN